MAGGTAQAPQTSYFICCSSFAAISFIRDSVSVAETASEDSGGDCADAQGISLDVRRGLLAGSAEAASVMELAAGLKLLEFG